jgi:phosphatidylserine decarboxylase
MLTPYGKREWLTILVIGSMFTVTFLVVGWYVLSILMMGSCISLLSFFRNPRRHVPTQRGVMVSPADGRVSSIHRLERFEPLGGPATCIRVFLSVLNVHVNRSPCHAVVDSIAHRDGQHLNALNPGSAEVNESTLMVLRHPSRESGVAAVRQVAGAIARTIVCEVKAGQILQRGQPYGMIKLGSTTELYIPDDLKPEVMVVVGQHVSGGVTVLAKVTSPGGESAQAQGGDLSGENRSAGVEVTSGSERSP